MEELLQQLEHAEKVATFLKKQYESRISELKEDLRIKSQRVADLEERIATLISLEEQHLLHIDAQASQIIGLQTASKI